MATTLVVWEREKKGESQGYTVRREMEKKNQGPTLKLVWDNKNVLGQRKMLSKSLSHTDKHPELLTCVCVRCVLDPVKGFLLIS